MTLVRFVVAWMDAGDSSLRLFALPWCMNDHLPADAFLSLLASHRSIRRYQEHVVPDADVRKAVEAGQAASTSSAVQSYCVLRVRDQARRSALVTLTGGQEKVARAGAFFVVCGDTRRHRLLVECADDQYETRLEAFLLAVIDATLFAQNFVLAFEAMGYGICYIGGLRNDLAHVDQLLSVPHGVYPLYGLCVGVPAEQPIARPRLDVDDVLFDDAFPDDETVLKRIAQYDDRYLAYLEARGVTKELRRSWSTIMARKFATPERTDISAYYRAKGADLS